MRRKKVFSILIIFGSLALLIVVYHRLKINRIDCQSQFGPCDDEIVSTLNSQEGKPIFSSYSSVREELNNHPKVSNYNIRFSNPRSLSVNVTQRRPQVAVIAEGANEYYLYSHDGILLESKNETQLPVIHISDISVITKEQMDFVIGMAYAINQTYNVEDILIKDGGMEFEVIGAPKIIFPVQGEIDVLLGSLTFVLSQLNSQLGEFRMEFIDFRFKNPVIKVQD